MRNLCCSFFRKWQGCGEYNLLSWKYSYCDRRYGFYIQALLYDIDFTDNGEDTSIREELELLGNEKGGEYLHELLQKLDPDAAGEIHPNNRKRVIRAIEFFRQTGEKISEHNRRRGKKLPYDFLYYTVNMDRRRYIRELTGGWI